jgi:ketosteroid isomerase-like protein
MAVASLRRLHRAQDAFYAGRSGAALRQLLTDDVVWEVPGENAIAGTYEGIEAVMDYFARRRRQAAGTFRLHPGDVLVGSGPVVAVLTDGTAVLGDQQHRWSTIGLYRFRGRRVAACRLIPLDPAQFDRIWSLPEGRAR